MLDIIILEVTWLSGLGRGIWNLEVPGSNPPTYRYLDFFLSSPKLNSSAMLCK